MLKVGKNALDEVTKNYKVVFFLIKILLNGPTSIFYMNKFVL